MISYKRHLDNESWLFIANFGSEALSIDEKAFGIGNELRTLTHTLGDEVPSQGQLKAYEARLYRL